MIEIETLRKSFGDHRILNNLNLGLRKGEVIVLIGPSGSGKSTLLRCINGLEPFEAGTIRIGDLSLRPPQQNGNRSMDFLRKIRLKVGMVFQSFNLFPHLTALENVTLAPTRVLGRSQEAAQAQAMELLKRVNLSGKEHKYPWALSGGEQQRVAIARALAMNPEVILFDEPTSALDPELVGEVLSVIAGLAADAYTMMIVTHHMQFARRSADRVVFLDGGEIVEEGEPEPFFQQPRTARAQAFLSSLYL